MSGSRLAQSYNGTGQSAKTSALFSSFGTWLVIGLPLRNLSATVGRISGEMTTRALPDDRATRRTQ